MGVKIPRIDMQGDETQFIKLREASKKWGCFRVINHGVPTELMAEIRSVAIDLFDRPVEIKQRVKKVLPGSGYVPPSLNNPVHEAFGLDITTSNCLSSFCDDIQASPRQRKIIENYHEATKKLAAEILSKMAGVTEKDDKSIRVWTPHFRMNKYSMTRDILGNLCLSTHTDASTITLLQEDDRLGGFEIVDPSGDLVAVDHFPSAFLINVGDLAVPWSNGKLRTLPHRVVCKDVGVRLSLATTVTPSNYEEDIVAHPNFLKGDCAPKYRPFKYSEYRHLRFSKKIYSGEMAEAFALEKPT